MKRLYSTIDKIVFSILIVSIIIAGFTLFSIYSPDSGRYSAYKWFWYISVVLIFAYIGRDLIVQRRINLYAKSNLTPLELRRYILRIILVIIFFVLTWFALEGLLSPVIIFSGSVLNYVLPKPSFESIYVADEGVICKAKLFMYEDVEAVDLKDSGIVTIKLFDDQKDEEIKFVEMRNAEVFYEHLLARI